MTIKRFTSALFAVMIVNLLLGILGCTDQGKLTSASDTRSFELRGPDGTRALMQAGAGPRDPLIIHSLYIPNESSSTPVAKGNGPQQNIVLALALAALTVYSAYETIRVCVPPFVDDWVLYHTINLRTKEACFETVAINVVSEGVAKRVIPAVKVTAARKAIKSMLGDVFTNRQLQTVFNRETKPTVTKLARAILEVFYEKLINGFRSIYNQVR